MLISLLKRRSYNYFVCISRYSLEKGSTVEIGNWSATYRYL